MIDDRESLPEAERRRAVWNQLEGSSAAAWIHALRAFEIGDSSPITNEMLFVYERSAPRAEREGSLAWSEVAVRAADLDAAHALSESERESALMRAMQMRSKFICMMGPRSGHPVLDVHTVASWVLAGLTLPIEKARIMTQAITDFRLREFASSSAAEPVALYDSMPVEDLVQLRRIKHRLEIAQDLADAGHLPKDSEIQSWLPLRFLLP